MTTLPGSAVGAGGAFTLGVKEPTDFFSVGDGAGDALLGEGAVVSAGFSLVLHAVSEPMPTMATAPATTATRRVNRDDHIISTHPFPPRWACARIIAETPEGVDCFQQAGTVGRLLGHLVLCLVLRSGFF